MTVPPDERPPYLRAADELRADIARGRYKPGDQLPGAPELEKRFSIAPMTLRNAMRILREEGLVYAVQGRGTFVRDTPGSPERADPEQGQDDEKVQVSAVDLAKLTTLLEAQQEQIRQLAGRLDALEKKSGRRKS